MKNKKKDNKGFTLVELLATLVILGLLTMIAAPNIIGMLQNSKLNTYVDDGKKLGTLAEYKLRGDVNMTKPGNNECIAMSLKFLGSTEFKNAPYGGTYDVNNSYVIVKNNGGTYEYYITLIENYDATKKGGLNNVKMQLLSGDNARTHVSGSITGNVAMSSLTNGSLGCTTMKQKYTG